MLNTIERHVGRDKFGISASVLGGLLPSQMTNSRAHLNHHSADAQTRRAEEHPAVWIERQRIGNALHEAFPREFEIVIIYLTLALASADPAEAQRLAAGALTTAELGLASARNLLQELRAETSGETAPLQPRWYPAAAVVERIVLGLTDGSGVNVSTKVQGVPYEVSMLAAEQITLIIKEATRNLVERACASRIEVLLDGCRGRLRIELRDDGVDRDPSVFVFSCSEIRGLTERAAALGAGIEIEGGGRRSGTIVRLTVPARDTGVRPHWPAQP